MTRRIMCYGASNTWGFKPGSFDFKEMIAERYSSNQRWTGILKKTLKKCEIIEEGLNGRTTMFDDNLSTKPYRNGLKYLPMCLDSHSPIDLVIFMLGTNDVKKQYEKTPNEIGEGMRQLVKCVISSRSGKSGNIPKVLVISPQPLVNHGLSNCFFDCASVEKSKKLSKIFEKICKEEKCEFLDSSKIITSSTIDGVHLDVSEHKKLSLAVLEKILNIFPKLRSSQEVMNENI